MAEGYTRGQVLNAVWRAFTVGNPSATPPSKFTARAKKMFLLGVPLDDEDRPGNAGTSIVYSAYHAFELTVALMLQDTGLKQAEAASFIKGVRGDLSAAYMKIMANPPVGRNMIPAEDRPSSPVRPNWFGKDGDPPIADTSCFMVFRYVEIIEAWRGGALTVNGEDLIPDHPFFLKPDFIWGVGDYAFEVQRFATGYSDHIRIVVELSHIASRVTSYLANAPIVGRGRPKKSTNY